MDEAWEMNMHVNPIDVETAETIMRHKNILMNHSDDFVAYIKHTESKSRFYVLFKLSFYFNIDARIQKIIQNIYDEKLRDFAKVDEDTADAGSDRQINQSHLSIIKSSKKGSQAEKTKYVNEIDFE